MFLWPKSNTEYVHAAWMAVSIKFYKSVWKRCMIFFKGFAADQTGPLCFHMTDTGEIFGRSASDPACTAARGVVCEWNFCSAPDESTVYNGHSYFIQVKKQKF